jgi:nitrate reductase NapE component
MLFIAYGLVPEHLRFSRALMLLGSASAIAVSSIRFLLIQYLRTGRIKLDDSYKKRILIVGNTEEKTRVQGLLNGLNLKPSFIGNSGVEDKQSTDLGSFDQLKDIVRIYEIDEVIFCAADISSETIINTMADEDLKNVHFKIAPPESMFIIGSHSIHTNGEMYTVDINGINNAQNKRNKRLLDLSISVIVWVLFPVLMIATLKPFGLLKNIFSVLFGSKTWVGYDKGISIQESLPKIKQGVISPSITFSKEETVPETVNRINALYAKDYQINNDLRLIWKGIRKLGN